MVADHNLSITYNCNIFGGKYDLSIKYSGGIYTQSYSKSGGRRNMYLLYFSNEICEGDLTGGFYGGNKIKVSGKIGGMLIYSFSRLIPFGGIGWP